MNTHAHTHNAHSPLTKHPMLLSAFLSRAQVEDDRAEGDNGTIRVEWLGLRLGL